MTQNITDVETVQIPDTAAELAAPPRTTNELHETVDWTSDALANLVFRFGGFDLTVTKESARVIQVIHEMLSVDEIVAFFRENDIKGDRNILETCPIANYFTNELGIGCTVDKEGIIYRDPKNDVPVKLSMSPQMKEFIKNFDQGMYPDLVA